MDLYQSCPCGSGKSFKWCCKPYFHVVEKARKQHQDGQHDAALRTVNQLVEQNPGSAPVLGYQAELLYMNSKSGEADEAIQKAFAINPDFAFGHWLRGVLRKDEGEIIGALLEFRKAAEMYDPKAREVLAEVFAAIFDIEMRLNRPVAARAALDRALQCDPTSEALLKAHDSLFSAESRLPECARRAYQLRQAEPSRAESWKGVVPAEQDGRLGAFQSAFEKLTGEDAADPSAWFNLGLVRSWQGQHPSAIAALIKSIELENDQDRNAEAGALVEVLRCGEGLQDQADYVEHRAFFQIQNPEPFIQLLEEWQRQNRLSGAQSDNEAGTFSTLILEETPLFDLGAEGLPLAKLQGYALIVQNMARIWGSVKEPFERLVAEVVRKLGPAISPPMHETGYCTFSNVAVEATLIPTRQTEIADIAPRLRQQAESFFEEVWVNRPLKALSGLSPLEAAGRPDGPKKLPGIIRFLEECFIGASVRVVDGDKLHIFVVYDFDNLRRKLGLATAKPAPWDGRPQPIAAMSLADLTALEPEKLSEEELDEAFRASLKLDARDAAGAFARTLIERPITSGTGDRHPYFNHLMQLASAQNDLAGLIALLDRAEQSDAQGNEGRRRNDYAVRRGQALAKTGNVEQAYQVFQDLLAREPNELKYFGPATETMLGQKRGPWAVQFAEQGLAMARSQNNRDSEQYFMELLDAARRLG
jgi:tetratricopeptide (TPR) repeat protein